VTFYTRTLAVPARRRPKAGETSVGSAHSSRSAARRATGPSFAPARATSRRSQTRTSDRTAICCTTWAQGLADGRPDGLASGSEWRTAPLWGVGLVKAVNGHTRFLHDGRARDLSEAILWHGVEARAAMQRFTGLPRDERLGLIAFLESL